MSSQHVNYYQSPFPGDLDTSLYFKCYPFEKNTFYTKFTFIESDKIVSKTYYDYLTIDLSDTHSISIYIDSLR